MNGKILLFQQNFLYMNQVWNNTLTISGQNTQIAKITVMPIMYLVGIIFYVKNRAG
jgi:hypothetical protein